MEESGGEERGGERRGGKGIRVEDEGKRKK